MANALCGEHMLHTFELCLIVFLRGERASPRCLITEKIQPKGVDDIDDRFSTFLNTLVGFFGGGIGTDIYTN